MSEIILFEELIKEKYNTLSASQKKATNYIFDNLEKAAFSTAVQIGQEAAVSDSTVIRLSYALGFKSFSEMQAAIQKQIMNSMKSANKPVIAKPVRTEEKESFCSTILKEQITMLDGLHRTLDEDKLTKAAEELIHADQVLVMGYYTAFTPAYDFYLKLSQMRPNVSFYRTTETEIQKLYTLNAESVVVAVSFPRHIKGTLKFTRQAQKQGAKVISVTESELAQISLEADIPFIVDVKADSETGFSPELQAMVLFHMLLLRVKELNREKSLECIENIQANLEAEDIYL